MKRTRKSAIPQSSNASAYLERGYWKDNTDRELYVPFKLVFVKHRMMPNPYDEATQGYSYSYYGSDFWTSRIVVRVKFERHTNKKLIKEALSYYFSSQGRCHHDYDCCGCVTYSTYDKHIRQIKRNEWVVDQSASVNC